MKKYIALGLLLISQTLFAANNDDAVVRAALRVINPGMQPDSVMPSSIPGMYEVVYGARLLYISNDGQYLFQGDIFDIKQRKNITDDRRSAIRLKTINTINEDQMLIFSPKEPKYTITVFTDIDCGYCRKLHNEMDAMNKLGIKVRYLFYPRSGPNTESYYKAVSVWCSDDQKQAMTDAKAGKRIPRKDCKNPVKQHMVMGELIGVSGTPTIVLENGRITPGYVPAKRLLALLQRKP